MKGSVEFSRSILWLMLVLGLLSGPPSALAGQSAPATGPAGSVDPLIGTGKGPGGPQNLIPGANLPFGMVQLSPDTEDRGYGYHYYQTDIKGFSMTHMSGPGCDNEGDVFFTATTGPVQTGVADFQSPYSHDQESAAPGYYRVLLSRWGVNAELTATERTGMARFTFPAGKDANLLVPISHTLNYTAAAEVRLVVRRPPNHWLCAELRLLRRPANLQGLFRNGLQPPVRLLWNLAGNGAQRTGSDFRQQPLGSPIGPRAMDRSLCQLAGRLRFARNYR